jgi:hypothetical protein
MKTIFFTIWECLQKMVALVVIKLSRSEKIGEYQDANIYCWKWSGGLSLSNNIFVHFEWFPLSYDTLFDNEKQLTLELHIEGNGKGDFIKLLYDKDKKECWQNNRRTYYSETFNISDGKSFAELNDEEQKDFLEGVYSSEKIQYLIELLNKTIEQMEVI